MLVYRSLSGALLPTCTNWCLIKHRGENFGNDELHSGAKTYAADHPHAPVNLNMTNEDIKSYRDCVNLCAAYGDYSERELEDEV